MLNGGGRHRDREERLQEPTPEGAKHALRGDLHEVMFSGP